MRFDFPGAQWLESCLQAADRKAPARSRDSREQMHDSISIRPVWPAPTDRLTLPIQFLDRCGGAALDGIPRLCHLFSSPRRGGGLRWGALSEGRAIVTPTLILPHRGGGRQAGANRSVDIADSISRRAVRQHGTLRVCHLISSPRRGGGLRWGVFE